MTPERTFTFHATVWSLLASLAVLAFAVVLCIQAWRRSGFRPLIGALELFRLLLVSAAVILLNQPEWVEEHRPDDRPVLAVLWDGSASMDTRDVRDESSPGGPMITRRETARALTLPAAWESVGKQYAIVIQPFSRAPQTDASNLHDPLVQMAEKYPHLRSVVLISDGDWNAGPPPAEAAARLRNKGIPVFAVPVGAASRLPDLELVSFDVPTFGVVGKSVRIPFSIDSFLPRDLMLSLVFTASDGQRFTHDVRLAAMSRTSDAIVWRPETTGDCLLTLEIPPVAEETMTDNNRREAPISIRQEKLKVLVIESYPRWEYRYLRNALSRDPGVEVSCLLFHPGLNKVGGGSSDYIKQFPQGLNELSVYDVVFLGDVGLDAGQLTYEHCEWLKGLVQQQASGLVFMPGMYGKQFSLLESPLEELYPVLLDSAQPGGWGSSAAGHFELTEAGRRSLLTRLADTPEETAEVWESLPGFQWYAPVLRAKAGSEVLCVHEEVSNNYGRLPLLVTRTYGAGKVLFMGTDGAWRWRRGVEDKYHYRFWGQVVRWMAYARNMAKGETMRLYYSPDQPQLSQNVVLQANVMEANGEPLEHGEVVARIETPLGRTETVPLAAISDQWGAYSGRYTCTNPGQHRITLVCRQTGASLETTFFVQGQTGERPGRPARPEVLEEIARISGGQVGDRNKLAELLRRLASLPEPSPIVRRLRLWCHPLTAGGVIFLLGAFWIGRKAAGLV